MGADRVVVSDITIPEHRARALDRMAVARLAESISAIGLHTPITVRYSTDDDEILLVAGLHRLEAARSLGWDTIPAIYTEGTADEARMWELAENLHRADLTALERAEHVDEWRVLEDKLRQLGAVSGGRGNEGGVRQVARKLGVPEQTVRRSKKIAELPDEAKEVARDAGLDDNAAALERAASQPSPAAQIAAIKREAERAGARRANAETDKLVKERRIEAVKEWLARRLDVAELHDLGEMLAGLCDPVSKALMREAA